MKTAWIKERDLTDSLEAVELFVSFPTAEETDDLSSRPISDTEAVICVLARALDSSIAERLHDLARNSMDSVGVSGGGQDLAGPFSSIFSNLWDELFTLHELTIYNTQNKQLVSTTKNTQVS